MKIYKLNALGNDFVLFDGRGVDGIDWNALTRRVCERRSGVGADGALILLRSAIADVRMRFIGADGSETDACGNAIRAFSRYCFENGVVRGTAFSVETGAVVSKPRILLKNGRVDGVRVDMGKPLPEAKDERVPADGRAVGTQLTVSDRTFPAFSLRINTPHTVIFVDSLNGADAEKYGPAIERDPQFSARTNVDFVEVISGERIKLLTWMRGSGHVPTCGTGACAAAVACALSGRTGRCVTVEVGLGTLSVEWSEADGHVYLTGPAEPVFSGVWNP